MCFCQYFISLSQVRYEHSHQTNIIRTRFSPWEMGSDYLFISRDTNKSISPTAHPYGQNPNQEGHAKRNIHKQRAVESPGFGLGFFCFPSIFFACSYNAARRLFRPKSPKRLPCSALVSLLCFWYPIGKKVIVYIREAYR